MRKVNDEQIFALGETVKVDECAAKIDMYRPFDKNYRVVFLDNNQASWFPESRLQKVTQELQ